MKRNYQHLLFLFLLSLNINCLAGLPTSVDGQMLPSLAPMLEKVMPAVVNISSTTHVRENALAADPFFRYFFDIPDKSQQGQSLGSGVIVEAKKGYVLTNYHVISKADEINVTLQDGRKFNAEIIGSDPETDITLLKIPAEKLMELPLANSDQLRVGDFVVAIGNPFGLGQTVTSGIVSALGRSGLGIEGYEDFIQTDASINPGNSGGALVNLRGELIGINTAILAPNGGNIGIGFAIPVNMAHQIAQHLAEFGKVQRGNLGINIQDLDTELASAFGLKNNKGVVIIAIAPNSSAAKSDLKPGDVIIAINDQPVDSVTGLRNRIGLLRVGSAVKLKVIRKGQTHDVETTIENTATIDGATLNAYLNGLVLQDSPDGIKVIDVVRHSFAWTVGFRKDDIIVGFNRFVIKDLEDLKDRIARRVPPYLIQIMRHGDLLSVLLR